MGEEEFRKFKEAIWITRISRIHSEKRLLEKENFCRILNVYYSFLTIVLSILSFVKKDDLLCLSAIFMSIFLLVAILYLDSQKLYERARNYRNNYSSLYSLELRLQHMSHADSEGLQFIEEQYCSLLNSNSNHTTFDYYCALADSSGEVKERRFTGWIPLEYYWGLIWRGIFNFILVVFPLLFVILYFYNS